MGLNSNDRIWFKFKLMFCKPHLQDKNDLIYCDRILEGWIMTMCALFIVSKLIMR